MRTAAIAGFLLVLPFIALEWANTQGFSGGFPIPLFLFMWLLGSLVVYAGMPMALQLAGRQGRESVLRIFFRLAVVALCATLWAGVVADQMPCFLGVPNCD